MNYIPRLLEQPIKHALVRGKSVMLLGARQTGKTTLINHLHPDLTISFIKPVVRLRYEKNPSTLTGEIEAFVEGKEKLPIICIDEVQKVPDILDVIQDLIDRKVAQFILTGSSARKLRLGTKVNLLPGRVVVFKCDPLTLKELVDTKINLPDLLLQGSLPGIITTETPADKQLDLSSYVTTYLEQEVRAEALVRQLGTFAQFLTLAASEAGNIININKLSQEIGISNATISSYYQILEDCLIIERIEPFIQTKMRRKLTKTPKYLFFDLGIRRVCGDEGTKLPIKQMGLLFEQWVGLELIRMARLTIEPIKIHFWRDPDGPEIDWVIKTEEELVPIEVKWTAQPTRQDIKHILLFMKEYPNANKGYVVCQTPQKIKLADNIYALPWQELDTLI